MLLLILKNALENGDLNRAIYSSPILLRLHKISGQKNSRMRLLGILFSLSLSVKPLAGRRRARLSLKNAEGKVFYGFFGKFFEKFLEIFF